ncbi:MAG: leucine-rich repeat domain-containing protein [Chitinispirillia bacterium]|nr:leucine-rich repeat domain-containing protein [Chitinispirillia bacterium]MCL2241862.1 leucine-rich repeat domain-containing protein [Chitinispirillia bacterium]
MAFAFCRNLKFVTISNGVKSIGENAFVECTALTSVTIPGSVTSIAFQAFAYCRGLTSVTISDGVRSIGGSAFYLCSSLISVTIPRSVTTIEAMVFVSCTSLTSVNVHKNNRSYVSVDGVLFNKAMDTLKRYPPKKQGTAYAIPNGVTTIEMYAFEDCANLTSVTIPGSVIEIGDRAFSYCSKLTSITIPGSVTSIVGGAFVNCTRLTSVTSLNPIPPAIDDSDNPFNGIPWGAALLVPAAGIDAYRQAYGWKNFGSYNIRPIRN